MARDSIIIAVVCLCVGGALATFAIGLCLAASGTDGVGSFPVDGGVRLEDTRSPSFGGVRLGDGSVETDRLDWVIANWLRTGDFPQVAINGRVSIDAARAHARANATESPGLPAPSTPMVHVEGRLDERLRPVARQRTAGPLRCPSSPRAAARPHFPPHA